jgi:D-glycerate 3-kinase
VIERAAFEAMVCAWIADAARGFRSREGRALCVGVSAPQGAGKSTLCERLIGSLAGHGLRAATLSIDDVYLSREEQAALARENPGNRYLEVRGYPGTHDVALGERTLDALSRLGAGESMSVVAYDKGAFEGAGDRAHPSQWRAVEGPLDVVLFEGWMLAFSAVDHGALAHDPSLAECNERLRAYEGWRARVDQWLLLRASPIELVIDWRIESEQRRRAADGRGMSDEQARDYVERFLPAYRTWSPEVERRVSGDWMLATLGADRRVAQLTRREREK